MSEVYVFPGQGSQKIGMGHDLFNTFSSAREVFEEVDDALDQHLSKLMFSDDEAELNMTVNTQPALMAVSVATLRVLEKEAGLDVSQATCVLGHSLGEYSALVAAGTFDVRTAAQLLRTRGQAMQDAVPVGVGSMAAVIGLDAPTLEKVTQQAAESDVCSIANDNSAGQIVISGHANAIDRAMQLASEAGAKKCIKLPVSAPFHCQLMAPAASVMEKALNQADTKMANVPVLMNVTAQVELQPASIIENLVAQVTGQVRWRESVASLTDQGVTHIYEIGSGKVLTGLNKRIVPDIKCSSIQTPSDIELFANR